MGLLKEKEKHLWLVQLPGEGRSSFREKGGRDGDRSGSQRVGRVGFAGKTMEGAEQASVTGFADLHFEIWPPRKKCLRGGQEWKTDRSEAD